MRNTDFDPEPAAAHLWSRFDQMLRRSPIPPRREQTTDEKDVTEGEFRDDSALRKWISLAIREAAFVQCVGMPQPIHLFNLYQQQRLVAPNAAASGTISVEDLLQRNQCAVIFAPPGHGKTIFLNSSFLKLHNDSRYLPILFMLRHRTAIGDIASFVNRIVPRLTRGNGEQVVLLIDGYDEIEPAQRSRLAEILKRFVAKKGGLFILTCRQFYDVVDVNAWHYHLKDFTVDDAQSFIRDLSEALDYDINPEQLVSDLRARHFDDFLANPLLLSLICVLKSGPVASLPDTSIALIQRAIDTLTFRWDHLRSISRSSTLGLDGRAHLGFLRRIAHEARSLTPTETAVFSSARAQLSVLQRADISPAQLMTELAQWYGLLVPIAGQHWRWAHRTIHDFLAAEYQVHTGKFIVPQIVHWDTKAAYAACLISDATEFLVTALGHSREVHVVAECLRNQAWFDPQRVANAVIHHLTEFRTFTHSCSGGVVCVSMSHNFFPLASGEFLTALLIAGLRRTNRTEAHDVVVAAVEAEYRKRQLAMPAPLASQLRLLAAERGTFQLEEPE